MRMFRIKPVDFRFMEALMFLGLCGGLSQILVSYEQIMNYGGKLDTVQIMLSGAPVAAGVHTTNLFNEGPIGYGLLIGMAIAAYLSFRDFRLFYREVCSLAYSENIDLAPIQTGQGREC